MQGVASLALAKALLKQTKPVAVKPRKAPTAMLKAKKAPAPSRKPVESKKVPDVVAIKEDGWEEVVTQNRRGRQIKLPTRFKYLI